MDLGWSFQVFAVRKMCELAKQRDKGWNRGRSFFRPAAANSAAIVAARQIYLGTMTIQRGRGEAFN